MNKNILVTGGYDSTIRTWNIQVISILNYLDWRAISSL